jgi:hypothetical protein
VSARHQVKRLDRVFREFALSKTGPAEETSFLRSVRIFKVRNLTGRSLPELRSGPDVFADALVPGPARMMPGALFSEISKKQLFPSAALRPGAFARAGWRLELRTRLLQWLSFREAAG